MKAILLALVLSGFSPAQIATVQATSGSAVTVTLTTGTTMSVPQDPANGDWMAVQAWRAQGNTVTPVATPVAYYDPEEAIQIRLRLSAVASEITSATPSPMPSPQPPALVYLQNYRQVLANRLATIRSLPLSPGTQNSSPTAP